MKPGAKALRSGARWLAGSAAIALLCAGGWYAYSRTLTGPPEAVAVEAAVVERDSVETAIAATGTVQLGGQQTLKSPVEGRVAEVRVAVGDTVARGQPLMVLRDNQLEDIEDDFRTEEVTIAQRQVAVDRARQAVLSQQRTLADEREELAERQALEERGFIPGTEVDAQERQVRQAEETLQTRELELEEARLNLENARLTLDKNQQDAREKRQTLLENSRVVAPVSGTVLRVDVKPGDGVARTDTLLTLGDRSQELVVLALSVLDANRVRVGQRARVSVIGPDAEEYPARVVRLSPLATTGSDTPSGPFSSGSNPPAIETFVQLDRPTGTLIPGAQVSVTVVLESRDNVPVLPVDLVQRDEDGEPFAWVAGPDDQARKRPLKLGLEDLTAVEVVSGLAPGDRVLRPPLEEPLEEGTPVEILPSEDAAETDEGEAASDE